MGYIGNPPAERYTSIDKQTITGDGTVGPYTLTHSVGNAQEIEVFVNNVRQEPAVAYTVAADQLTMTGAVDAADDFYVVFQGKAKMTATHPSTFDLSAANGTFTGDLTVDTSTLYVDSTNNRVGIGTASPSVALDVQTTAADAFYVTGGRAVFTTATNSNGVVINGIGTTANYYFDIRDDGATGIFRVDPNGRVGIGTSSPGAGLEVENANGIIVSRSGYSQYLQLQPANNSVPTILGEGGNGVHLGPTNTTGIRVDSSGNVGIGTTSPLGRLHVTNPSGVPAIYFDGANSDIGYASAGVLQFGEYDGSTYTERMRIDSSGNLLVGNTTNNTTQAGVYLNSNGRFFATHSGSSSIFNRLSTDGDILLFQKDTSTVGSIASSSGSLQIDTGGNYLSLFSGSGNVEAVWDAAQTGGTWRPGADNTSDIGYSARRWKDLYLSGGVYVGGTGSANYLDDYEEGSGTFSLEDATSGGNVSSTTGSFDYVKIGKVVHLRYNFENINTSGLTAGNSLYVHGFPFTATQNHRGIVFSQFLNVDTGTYDLEFRINGGTTYGFWNMCKDAASGAVVTASDMSSGNTDMRGSITYFTSS